MLERAEALSRKPPLPFVPGHGDLHHCGGPCHAYGAAALPPRIPVFLLHCHPDDYLTRLGGERPRDGPEPLDARAILGQQEHLLPRVGHEGGPALAERHLFTKCISLQPRERLGDWVHSREDIESLVIRYTGCSLYRRRELVGDV